MGKLPIEENKHKEGEYLNIVLLGKLMVMESIKKFFHF
jgi:hypothetical protein